MDSNSEGSFAWTDASDDTSDNEMMKESGSSTERSGEESECGKSYKTNLQKQLFANGGSDHCNGKSRKRKLSDSDPTIETTNKKKIKIEPESDLDSTRNIKRKRRSSNRSETSLDPYNESYLERKVKNERNSTVPTPVKHQKKKSKVESSADRDTDVGRRSVADGSPSTPDIIRKSKTKKNKSESHADDSQGGDGPTRDDRLRGRRSERDAVALPRDDTSPASLSNESDDGTEKTEPKIPSRNGTRQSNGNSKRKSRTSDRITFENESNDESSGARGPAPSSRLAAFARAAAAHRPLARALAAPPDADDELWLVACPADADAAAFRHRTWALAGRCKIKLDGRAYEGAALPRLAALCLAGGAAPAVRALRLRGSVRLRRRLPRAPAPARAPAARAPLPAPPTRPRHPLLGAHYRSRLKLRAGVAGRLRRAAAPAPPPPPPPKPEPEPPPRSDRKKRKRERARPSADTWDSERAIEETLFAF